MLDRIQSTATEPATAEKIAALVAGLLGKRGINRTVAHDEDLTGSGLSSLDTVNLMLAVEAEFNVKIPDRDMIPANFRTIRRIETLVGGLRGA